MSNYSQRVRIQNHLMMLAKAFMFAAVTYDATTGLANQINNDTMKIAPVSANANEISSNFEVDLKQGRHRALLRTPWTFELHLTFDVEVMLEEFEASLIENAISLAKDAGNGLDQVFIELISSNYIHPVKQEAPTGTKAVFTFTARTHRH